MREVEEETGLRCRLGPYVGRNSYRDNHRRLKTVDYWQMLPIAGDPLAPANEVDDARWVTLEAASQVLSYDRDRRLVADFEPKE